MEPASHCICLSVLSSLAVATPSPSKFDYSPLNLNDIRDTLSRLEESVSTGMTRHWATMRQATMLTLVSSFPTFLQIIFALIERAQFKLNPRIYRADSSLPIHSSSSGGSPISVLSYFLLESEKLGATVRRYTSPAEHPFSPLSLLPAPLLPPLIYPPTIRANNINHNGQVMRFYLGTVLPSICEEGDDENWGSSALCDVSALQLLSKRIHYGKFVAESKFRSEPRKFSEAIRARDVAALTAFITKPLVEEQVLARVRQKAAAYGRPPLPSAQSSPHLGPIALAEGVAALKLEPAAVTPDAAADASASSSSSSATPAATLSVPVASSSSSSSSDSSAEFKVSPEVIAQLYEIIMTLNKDVQIEYLLHRLDDE